MGSSFLERYVSTMKQKKIFKTRRNGGLVRSLAAFAVLGAVAGLSFTAGVEVGKSDGIALNAAEFVAKAPILDSFSDN